jgi:hypothetical protein
MMYALRGIAMDTAIARRSKQHNGQAVNSHGAEAGTGFCWQEVTGFCWQEVTACCDGARDGPIDLGLELCLAP